MRTNVPVWENYNKDTSNHDTSKACENLLGGRTKSTSHVSKFLNSSTASFPPVSSFNGMGRKPSQLTDRNEAVENKMAIKKVNGLIMRNRQDNGEDGKTKNTQR